MKPHAHKAGQSISVNGSGGQSHINEWKQKMALVSEGLPVREFLPLRSIGFATARAAEREKYAAIPSLVRNA